MIFYLIYKRNYFSIKIIIMKTVSTWTVLVRIKTAWFCALWLGAAETYTCREHGTGEASANSVTQTHSTVIGSVSWKFYFVKIFCISLVQPHLERN